MSTLKALWKKLANKEYREEFVAAQVKRGIPFQIRTLMKQQGITQETLAERSGLKQGVISRAADPEYGNLTLNTIIRIAAGFDVAFVGQFVPFSQLGDWFEGLNEERLSVKTFATEDSEKEEGVYDNSRACVKAQMPSAGTTSLTSMALGIHVVRKDVGKAGFSSAILTREAATYSAAGGQRNV